MWWFVEVAEWLYSQMYNSAESVRNWGLGVWERLLDVSSWDVAYLTAVVSIVSNLERLLSKYIGRIWMLVVGVLKPKRPDILPDLPRCAYFIRENESQLIVEALNTLRGSLVFEADVSRLKLFLRYSLNYSANLLERRIIIPPEVIGFSKSSTPVPHVLDELLTSLKNSVKQRARLQNLRERDENAVYTSLERIFKN